MCGIISHLGQTQVDAVSAVHEEIAAPSRPSGVGHVGPQFCACPAALAASRHLQRGAASRDHGGLHGRPSTLCPAPRRLGPPSTGPAEAWPLVSQVPWGHPVWLSCPCTPQAAPSLNWPRPSSPAPGHHLGPFLRLSSQRQWHLSRPGPRPHPSLPYGSTWPLPLLPWTTVLCGRLTMFT